MKGLVALLLAIGPAGAAPPDIAGDYTHAFTEPENTVVWRVRTTPTGWQVTRTGDDATMAARALDAADRARLWARYDWTPATARDAACIAWAQPDEAEIAPGITGAICRVTPEARARIEWLSDNTSDAFTADAMGGVMAIRRLP